MDHARHRNADVHSRHDAHRLALNDPMRMDVSRVVEDEK